MVELLVLAVASLDTWQRDSVRNISGSRNDMLFSTHTMSCQMHNAFIKSDVFPTVSNVTASQLLLAINFFQGKAISPV